MFDDGHRFQMIVGSANLTKHGFETNTEAVLSIDEEMTKDAAVFDAWTTWWDEIWSLSDPVSEELIGGYEVEYQHERRLVVYGDRLVEAEVGGAEAESDEPHDADEATTLWIDAGRITGGAETQLQLIKLVAPYFLVRRRNQRKRLVLRRGSEDWDDSELKFYAQNDMWRINLSRDLVASTGSLRDRTVMFTRLSGEDAYEFKVLTDQEKQSARSLSRRTGVYGPNLET